MKKILIVWIIIAVLMVGGLTTYGFLFNNQNKPYKTLEHDLQEAAEGYMGMYPAYLLSTNKLPNEEMLKSGYSKELIVNNEKCEGYVEITNAGGVYKYKPYIKCKNYQTKGYEE